MGCPRRAHRRGVGRVARRPADRPPSRRRGQPGDDGGGGRPSRRALPHRRRAHSVAQRRGRGVGDAGGVANHQRAAPRHHPSRPRPRPRVPPQAHAWRADPARRRRRHQRFRLPLAGRAQGRRCGDSAHRHARRAHDARLATRRRHARLPRRLDGAREEHAPPRRARVVGRDGLLRRGCTAASRSGSRRSRTCAPTAPRTTRCGGSSRTAPKRSPAPCGASRRSCACGGRCRSMSPSASSGRSCCRRSW